jgi:hypothetical protein
MPVMDHDTDVEVDVDLTQSVPCAHEHVAGSCPNPAQWRCTWVCGCTEVLCLPCYVTVKTNVAMALVLRAQLEVNCDICHTTLPIRSFDDLVRTEGPL